MRFNAEYAKQVNKMNNKINETVLEIVLTNMYPLIVDLYDGRMKMLNSIYNTINNLFIKCKCKEDLKDDDPEIDSLFDKVFKEVKEFEGMQLQDRMNEIFVGGINEMNKEIKQAVRCLLETAGSNRVFASPNQMYSQINLFVRQSFGKIQNLTVSICNDIQSNTEWLEQELLKVANNLKDLLNEELEQQEVISDNEKILNNIDSKFNDYPSKILGYKELNKLADKAGYVFDRQRGDHATFTKNGKIIVIPQGRPIGKGLSLKIQKSINFGC